ncbi:hypothetical protein AVEN_203962-1 [Araneus ventricosus]|uniref:Helitron helicase-like domain-containing protein n=1 Tax=Araneus ventricosus TaxID=182803 RepID=A0A4Y2R8T1_ARAVE|nr:hypothetical protein AVEN_140472-1 [Araneus ventricosus]GBN71894.1 hypothetical protein AVEN_162189-1 [Araneus ventricosus]GBO10135.1 hypothetical protein AVEN_74506-1 [Araneus ventricosus]GBO10137.1 hypothetical protein AVEN_203962-1 [Araneus ventricosus]
MTYVCHLGRKIFLLILPATRNGQKSQISWLKARNFSIDIVVRVFQVKINHMMKLLIKGYIFGPTKCHMYSVEGQKRGLLHVLILLWLEEEIRPQYIDKVIRAEMPDHELEP